MEPCNMWIEKCEAARMIEDEFGTDKALTYLIVEKFLAYLDAAENLPDFRAGLPAFVAEIKKNFEPWQLEDFLKTARQGEPFDPSLYEDDEDMDSEDVEMERQRDLRRSAAELLLVEQARSWLFGDGD
jgi:hypothetical protein